MYDGFGWRPYVSVAERRRKAQKKMDSLRKKGRIITPVSVDGRTIAKTFWGKAWCDNLESYSDYENRLPRGRTYVRNGSVVDLQIAAGQIVAMVSGSEIYEVKVNILPVAKPRWKAICEACAGSIDSLVELLQGRLSKGVMERISQQQTGLFPSPKEIKLSCSCPDWATMCKHVAAVLYGVGARLDQQPELLFRLREVDEMELIASAGKSLPSAKQSPSSAKVLGGEDISKLFGLDIAESEGEHALPPKTARAKKAVAKESKPPAPSKKPAQKAVIPKLAIAKPAAGAASQTRLATKKKPSLASSKMNKARPGKAKPDESAVRKPEAAKLTKKLTEKSTNSTKKSAVSTTATKKKSTVDSKKPAVSPMPQTKPVLATRKGSVRRPA
jgi:uncharacterized Zn finger protein